MIPKRVTIEKAFKKILNDINKQVLKTMYTLNLGQLLWVIPNIKHSIFNLLPSKLVLLELVVTLVAIDHQMPVIQVQVRKNFIENVLELISLWKN
jgi:hypothetical protein